MICGKFWLWIWIGVIIDGGFDCVVYRSSFATVPSWSFFQCFYIFLREERDDGWLHHVRGRRSWWFGVILFFLDVVWRGKNVASLCYLSCLIFRWIDLITFFAIAIHFANEFVFNSENFVISFANHLDCSFGEPCLDVVGSVYCYLSGRLHGLGYNNFSIRINTILSLVW